MNGTTNLHEYKNQLFIVNTILIEDDNDIRKIATFNEHDMVMSREIASLIEPLIISFMSRAEEMIKRFRWLTNIPFDQNEKGKYIPLAWSFDNKSWNDINWSSPPNWLIMGFIGDDVIKLVDDSLIKKLIVPNLNLSEPICHDMLHEAKNLLKMNSIRAAFIVGFTALEIGVKEYIQSKVPSTQWLVQESPSPDILKICSRYLPSIDKNLELDKYEKNLLKKYMESRNKVIHRGSFEEDSGTVTKKLYMVEYMLHRFDYSTGLEGARLYAEKAKDEMLHSGSDNIS